MMTRLIEFYDGNSGELLSSVPSEEVPAPNREVYFREQRLAPSFREGDTVVPIARVVKTWIDDQGTAVDQEQANFVRIEEFDADGQLLRMTRLERPPSA